MRVRQKVVGLLSLTLLTAACGTVPTHSAGASKTSSSALAAAFPQNWTMDAGNPGHNSAYSVPSKSPRGLVTGYDWKYAEVNAVPLHHMPPETAVVGRLRASVRMTQTMGNALGVSAVKGVIYSESDSGAVYALNGATGHLLWKRLMTNEAMGNPVVVSNRLFLGTGNSNFSFRELINYAHGQPVMRGTGVSGVYALNAKTGSVLWHYNTAGEDMPTPSYLNGVVYEANGSGNMFALQASNGSALWKTHIGGFDSMSSPVAWTNVNTHKPEVVASFSNPNQVVAVSGTTGKVLWRQTLPGAFDTGLGDEVPAVSVNHNLVLVNSVVNPKTSHGKMTVNLAMEAINATTGKVVWKTKFGRGSMPPAFKAGVPLISGNTIYMNAPATDTMHAINLTTGKVLWSFRSGYPGRAAPVLYHGVLYFGDGPDIFSLNPHTGQLLARYKAGGLFGIVNPVIVGGTMYLDSSNNWVMALPLKTVNPSAKS